MGLPLVTPLLIKKEYHLKPLNWVKIIVILKGKLELTKGLLVYLVVMAVLYKILNRLNLNFMACLLKNLKQLVNR